MAFIKTQVIPAHKSGAIDRAVEHLIAGQLVAIPTETVYGLAADALNPDAVQNIFEAKGRPANNPLICHVSSIQMAKRYVAVTEIAEKLMHEFWPGPLTFVLPKQKTCAIPEIVGAGLPTLAVRCPANETARTVIDQLDHPIAAPSANVSGKLSPTSAQDVLDGLVGKISLVIDGGLTSVGIESTIIGISNNDIILLRPGTITVDDISRVTGSAVKDRDNDTITAPGQLKSHYAPNAAVRLNAQTCGPDEILIGFGRIAGDITLSKHGDLHEAARKLFSTLRTADEYGKASIAVAPIPAKGVGIAINDRLARAAAPRPTGTKAHK